MTTLEVETPSEGADFQYGHRCSPLHYHHSDHRVSRHHNHLFNTDTTPPDSYPPSQHGARPVCHRLSPLANPRVNHRLSRHHSHLANPRVNPHLSHLASPRRSRRASHRLSPLANPRVNHRLSQIGSAHVCSPVTHAVIVFRLPF